MMSSLPTIDELRHYILANILNNSEEALSNDKDLLLSGLLDSISVMRLVAHIEAKIGASIPPEDLLPEHFGTLDKIEAYLESQHR